MPPQKVSLSVSSAAAPRLGAPSSWYAQAVLEQRAFASACTKKPARRAVPSTLRRSKSKSPQQQQRSSSSSVAPAPAPIITAPTPGASTFTPLHDSHTSSSLHTPVVLPIPALALPKGHSTCATQPASPNEHHHNHAAAAEERHQHDGVGTSSPLSLGPSAAAGAASKSGEGTPGQRLQHADSLTKNDGERRNNSTEPPPPVSMSYATYEAFKSPALSHSDAHDSLSMCSEATGDGNDGITHEELQQSGRQRRGSQASSLDGIQPLDAEAMSSSLGAAAGQQRQQQMDDRELVEPSPMTDGNSPHRGDTTAVLLGVEISAAGPSSVAALQRRRARELRQKRAQAEQEEKARRDARQRASWVLERLRKESVVSVVGPLAAPLQQFQAPQSHVTTEKLIGTYLATAATDVARRRMSLSGGTLSQQGSAPPSAPQSTAGQRRSLTPQSSAALAALPPLPLSPRTAGKGGATSTTPTPRVSPRGTSTVRSTSASPSPRRGGTHGVGGLRNKAPAPGAAPSTSPPQSVRASSSSKPRLPSASVSPRSSTHIPPPQHHRYRDPAQLPWSARALPVTLWLSNGVAGPPAVSHGVASNSGKVAHHHHNHHAVPLVPGIVDGPMKMSRSPSSTAATILDAETHSASHHAPRLPTPPPRSPVGAHGETTAVGSRGPAGVHLHRTPSPQPIGPHGATASASRRGSGTIAGLLGDINMEEVSRRTSRSVSPTAQ